MDILEKEIGEAAGKIWEALHGNEPMSRTKISKKTGLSVVSLNQGIGWLAREGKLAREKKNRKEPISLKD